MKKYCVMGLLLLSACSNPLGSSASAVDANYGAPAGQPAIAGFEPVSGSRLSQPTASAQRKVDVTVGSSLSEIKVTTSRNRTAFLSVQGQMVSK